MDGYMVNGGLCENIVKWDKKDGDSGVGFLWEDWEEEGVKKIEWRVCLYEVEDIEFVGEMGGWKG